jgi:hypothetical protein
MKNAEKNAQVKKTYKKKSKSVKAKAPEATSKNVQKNVEAKGVVRDVKYLYPAEAVSKEDRKAFRTSARSKVRSFDKKITKAKSEKEGKALTKEKAAFMKETFVEGVKATIS